MDEEMKKALGIVGLIGAGIAGLVLLFGSWFYVGVGEVGVKVNRGTGTTSSVLQGLHFKIPLIEGVRTFNVQTQRVDLETEGASKDIQRVIVHAALNYHLLHDKVNELYVTVGPDYEVKVIEPATKETIKAVTAQFPAESIIVHRNDVKNMIETALKDRLADYSITLETLNLVDIKFSDDFNEVVEQKQIEEQKIKTAEYVKRQAEENKQATILTAQADAERQRLLRQNATHETVALKWIEKWNGTLPSTIMGDKAQVLMGINNESK